MINHGIEGNLTITTDLTFNEILKSLEDHIVDIPKLAKSIIKTCKETLLEEYGEYKDDYMETLVSDSNFSKQLDVQVLEDNTLDYNQEAVQILSDTILGDEEVEQVKIGICKDIGNNIGIGIKFW